MAAVLTQWSYSIHISVSAAAIVLALLSLIPFSSLFPSSPRYTSVGLAQGDRVRVRVSLLGLFHWNKEHGTIWVGPQMLIAFQGGSESPKNLLEKYSGTR